MPPEEDRAKARSNMHKMVKFGRFVFELNERTDRQTEFVFEKNVCNNKEKRKNHAFLILIKKVLKTLKTYLQLHKPINHSAFNTQLL